MSISRYLAFSFLISGSSFWCFCYLALEGHTPDTWQKDATKAPGSLILRWISHHCQPEQFQNAEDQLMMKMAWMALHLTSRFMRKIWTSESFTRSTCFKAVRRQEAKEIVWGRRFKVPSCGTRCPKAAITWHRFSHDMTSYNSSRQPGRTGSLQFFAWVDCRSQLQGSIGKKYQYNSSLTLATLECSLQWMLAQGVMYHLAGERALGNRPCLWSWILKQCPRFRTVPEAVMRHQWKRQSLCTPWNLCIHSWTYQKPTSSMKMHTALTRQCRSEIATSSNWNNLHRSLAGPSDQTVTSVWI